MKKYYKVIIAILFVALVGASSFRTSDKAVQNKNNSIRVAADTSIQPIHKYTFDNDNGNTVMDTGASSTLYNGTANGTQVSTEDGQTFRTFNGNTDYITFTNPVIPTGKKSIKFKVKGNNISGVIFENCADHYYENGVSCSFVSQNQLDFRSEDGNGQKANKDYNSGPYIIDGTKSFSDGQWHTVLITDDGTTSVNGLKMYIDDMSNPVATATAKSQELSPSHNLIIGKSQNEVAQYAFPFSGSLADLEIYDTVIDTSVPVKGITLNKTTDTINVGESDNLVATITPDNATNKNVTWTSSDSSIVTVDQNGKITGVKPGKATITVKTADGGLTATCEVTVVDPNASRALLEITMSDGDRKEYDLGMDEVNKFVDWYNNKTSESYKISKDYNVGPFDGRDEYIAHDKVSSFEVKKYTKGN